MRAYARAHARVGWASLNPMLRVEGSPIRINTRLQDLMDDPKPEERMDTTIGCVFSICATTPGNSALMLAGYHHAKQQAPGDQSQREIRSQQ